MVGKRSIRRTGIHALRDGQNKGDEMLEKRMMLLKNSGPIFLEWLGTGEESR
jgi:hypothetical protein